ncbi:MAG: GDP-L-fucose synthase [bacterium]|nr:MAG: GDP-L-fucose synthase [bacterium]
MNNYFKNKKVLITGGKGFLGTHLIEKLKELKPKMIRVADRDEYDLTKYEDCLKASKGMDLVIHLAAKVGGIGFNREFPADLFDDNILMGTFMMKASRINKVKKYLALGTICAYPKFTPVPFKEESLWNGYPEETNAPYGLAKKMQLVQSQSYRDQFGFNSIFLLPVNLYGPGDNFNPKSSHVIPALIKKFVTAEKTNKKEVVVWGTGTATREFLYVKDAVEGILMACEKYDKSEPVNLGAGFEISIKDLAGLIKKLTNFKGKIVWDKTKPDGQPRRKLSTLKAKKEFGFKAKTSFEIGLKETIDWYKKNKYEG